MVISVVLMLVTRKLSEQGIFLSKGYPNGRLSGLGERKFPQYDKELSEDSW